MQGLMKSFMKYARVLHLVLILLCINGGGFTVLAIAQIPPSVGPYEGSVTNIIGNPIEGATVLVTDSNGKILFREKTDENGQFPIPASLPTPIHLLVKHPDYKDRSKVLEQQDSLSAISITLDVRPLQEALTVTATRTEQTLTSVPSNVEQLDSASLQRSPAITLDDTLRQIPSFSLFRRSSSLVAHPTTQGVSLRGIGPSGVSRTLVLWDGTPLNDPFGGWIYWSQLDKNILDSVEVAPGGGSSLYGSSPLGGVIQIFSRVPEENRLELDILGGTQGTAAANIQESFLKGPWSGNFSGSFLNTEGYYIVPVEFRGPVDDRANSVHYAVRAGGIL